jgi:hypothetical protein
MGIFTNDYEKVGRQVGSRLIQTQEMAPQTWGGVFHGGYDVHKVEDVTFGVARLKQAEVFKNLKLLSEYDAKLDPNRFVNDYAAFSGLGGPSPTGITAATGYYQRHFDDLQELAELHGIEIESWDQIEARVNKDTKAARDKAHRISMGASPEDRLWAEMTSFAASLGNDPVILSTLAAGGWGRKGASFLAKLTKTMWTEAAVLGSIEAALVQPQIWLQKRDIESPYTVLDAAKVALMVAAGGAVFRGAVETIGRGIGKGSRAYQLVRNKKTRKKIVLALRDEAARLEDHGTVDARTEAHVLHQLSDAIETTPPGKPIDIHTEQVGQEQIHFSKLDDAAEAVNDGRVFDGEPSPGNATTDVTKIADFLDADTVMINPRIIETDATTFQYKADTDIEGVSSKLKGVTKWDDPPASSGIAIIYERADGRLIVVDGHQRLGLAKRLLDAGGDPNEILIRAKVFREADGVSVEDVRQKAALKNIGEGTGTALDAAKVMRDLSEEDLANLPFFPTDNALARDAAGLALLDDDAFAYVANVLNKDDYGRAALVGQIMGKGPEQLAAIRALIEANPANLAQARFIIDQIKEAGFAKTETMDLFGGQTISESLFKERAKILDKTLTTIRKDKSLNKTLIQRESYITGAGNVLERDANLARLGENEYQLQTLSRLANSKGPISDALNDAARRLKDGEKLSTVSGDFLDTLGREATGEYRGRSSAGDTQREIPTRADDVRGPELGRPVHLDDLPESAREKVEAEFRGSQQAKVKTLAGLIGKDGKLAKRHQNELESAGELVAKETGAEHVAPPALKRNGKVVRDAAGDTIHYKDTPQIERKVKDKYHGRYWRITDVTRTSFLVDTPAQAEAVIQALGKRLRSLDEGWQLDPTQGYLDRKVLVRYNDGLIGEVQIIGREMWSAKFKKGGHAAYYKWRETHYIDSNGERVIKDQEAFDALNKQMADLYEGANQASKREFQSLFDSLRASERTSETSTVRQDSPGSTLDQAERLPDAGLRTTTTGIPSQESRSTILSEGGERAVGIDESIPEDVLEKQIASDWARVRADIPGAERSRDLLVRDWPMTDVETKMLRDILADNPDIEIPRELRFDSAGEIQIERQTLREVMAELDETATKTKNLIDCYTGKLRG